MFKQCKSNNLLDRLLPLYEIFAPSTPEAVRAEALARAEAGELITKLQSITEVRQHRQLNPTKNQN